jgi:predicted Zn-ribbon and HTH transcriptional regulator
MMDEQLSVETQQQIRCPKCQSTNWRCYNETSRPCYDNNGDHVGDRVIGGLVCNDCGVDWLDYSVDPQLDNPDCECEDY